MAPAPVKNNSSGSNKSSTNSNSISSNSSQYTTNAAISSSSGGGGRKQTSGTGTVPKATTATKSTSTTQSVGTETVVSSTQHGQKSILQPNLAQLANRCSPLNIVASIQQQQQQQTRSQQQQQYKNTEIVAPIRRELKDLNDYLLTTVVTTANNTNNNPSLLQQQPSIGAGSTNSDIENSQENQQRFCYPVRPIPRRNQSQSQHQTQQLQNDFLNAATTIGVVIPTTPGLPASNSNVTSVQPNNSNPNATGNTTAQLPDSPSVLGQQFEQQIQLLVLQRLKQLFENSQTSPFLNLTTSLLPGIQASSSASLSNTILNHNSNEITQLAQRFHNLNNNSQKSNLENSNSLPPQPKRVKASSMVHEINPSSTSQNEVVVNSTSLEDVPLNEQMSDRAQSIQSLHSNIETPTPDNTPSYEELQQRLEASNRNIHNMQEQQQQLLKLQNAAKQHLSDMEKLRQQAGTLSFPSGSQPIPEGDDGAPEYQSLDQVHSDMATLVGRMKNLTSFIHNQNELSTLLGDDGPDILAEQEALQRKLESLRTQRDEMRSLVTELQGVNRSAEESAKEARQRQFEQEKDIEENDREHAVVPAGSKKSSDVEREAPEYSRNVPIELLHKAQRPQPPQQRPQINGNEHSETETDMDDDERKETAELIQQKVADIEAMKAQLKRLKDMMETVNLIEAHTGKDPKLVGRTPPREVPIIFDRERTPVASALPPRYSDDNGNEEEFISRKVRMLNEVTSDLRAQAESLQAEKDRIHLLKAEIERRKNQAAAAVQMGDDALKRNSLTPTPVPRSHEERWDEHLKTQHERDQLKEEYERKKKEFEVICKRLEQEDGPDQQAARARRDIVSEADDEAEEDNIESDYAESAKFVPTSTPATSRNNENNSRAMTGKDSLNSTGVSSNTGTGTHIAQAASSTHDGASLEAASLQSGSSRSFSIPPPMSAMGINFAGPIPPPLPTAWNPHQYYYATGGVPPPPPPPQTSYGLTQTNINSAPLSNSECICTANNLGAATSSSTATSAAATNNATLATDPMLQQFIQTQQMLINSVCQCNQMLWHQQREIDSLNQTITFLQDRIISLGGTPNVNNPDVGYTLRSESVPPASLGGIPTTHTHALPNNLYLSMNRAQSEQPAALYIAPGQNRGGGAFSNYHQQHHHVYRRVSQHQQPLNAVSQAGGPYSFSTDTQQHNASSTASASMYSTLNNAVPPPPAPTTLFNNEIPPTPQSPVVGSGPAPIFMHHHNNSIHQNNANLRTQNQQQQHQHHSNLSGSTLNNQVPPGNRANNYWDNFRSYSRQNLLSTNYSTKSNEEQQQMLQQQQQQHNQPETTSYERTQSMQQHPSQQHLYHEQNLNLDDCVNNLNYAATTTPNNETACNTATVAPTNNTTSAADIMYHNYNIHQSNKVGPKPNWRFRNLNEDYPSINRLQQQQRQQGSSLPRYQNTSFPQQQPQPPLGTPQFLNYLPQSQTTTRNHDFLLRPSLDVNEDDVSYEFNTSEYQNIVPHNENNEDEEEDDTTSEEIKRNLLVNALKNDKFTTKFYESIKEDVFRRLESMLLDKDNVAQASASGTAMAQQPQLFNNNISNTPRNDFSTANDENVDNENEKPEEDTNWRQNNINSGSANSTPSQTCTTAAIVTTTTTKNCTKKRKNIRKQSLNNNSSNATVVALVAVAKEDENNENRGACSLAAQHHQKLQQENKDKQNENKNPNSATSLSTTMPSSSAAIASPQATNECDLIKYIISRIRNQTHPNTLINDALLVEVAKLTATTVAHAQPLIQNNNSSNNISPKKIYTKIKKLTIPKDRDEFLLWYQQYLENTLFCNSAETKTKPSSSKSPNNQQEQTIQQNGIPPTIASQPPTQQDDGDLAEADQNCSSNTSGGNGNYHHLESDATDVTTKAEVDETQDTLEGACALVKSSSTNLIEDSLATATCEKNDMKSEKQDYDEKE